MIIYLHCEGVTDYAVIPHIIKKASKMPDLDIRWIGRDTLKKVKIHRKSDIAISGHYKHIKALATFSLKNNCKYIAYHQDADGKYAEHYNKIVSEFTSLKEGGFHCLAIVPKETIESWLLADENAYPFMPNKPKLPTKPEEIWGQKKDKNSNHPYNYLVRVLFQFRLSDNRDTYAHIAENIDIETVKNRCPESFAQFIHDIQEFFEGDNSSHK
jgi:hypothetical protein